MAALEQQNQGMDIERINDRITDINIILSQNISLERRTSLITELEGLNIELGRRNQQ